MTIRPHAAYEGYSLIELLIVLTILAVLATFAVFALGDSTQNLARQAIAKEFKAALQRARSDSVRRRANVCADMARIEITSSTSFALITDPNQDGVIEPNERTEFDFTTRSHVSIVDDPWPDFPIVIRFDQRGRTTSGSCGAETPVYTPTVFCERPCSFETANAQNSSLVFVSPTGTVALLDGGDSLPTFADPTVTSLDHAPRINPMLAVWDQPDAQGSPSPGSSGSPSPSASPTQSPTPTPTTSPEPTPSPTATASPSTTPAGTPISTPTPVPIPSPLPYCLSGQRPATDNCRCAPNQYLHSNGRCRNI